MRCIECNVPLTKEEEKNGRCDECIQIAREATEDYLENLADEKYHELRDEYGAKEVRRMFGVRE